jgi:hypothetical protein
LDLDGLIAKIAGCVADIDIGRKGLATDGEEHVGRLSYEAGISAAGLRKLFKNCTTA